MNRKSDIIGHKGMQESPIRETKLKYYFQDCSLKCENRGCKPNESPWSVFVQFGWVELGTPMADKVTRPDEVR